MIARGDRRGPVIRFPQPWLLLPFDVSDFEKSGATGPVYAPPPNTLRDALRQALLPHLHQPSLTVEQASELCGYKRRDLARRLKNMDTKNYGEPTRAY